MSGENIIVRVDDHSDAVRAALENAIQRWAMAAGEKASTYAKDNIETQGAVDQGRLKNSITYQVKEE